MSWSGDESSSCCCWNVTYRRLFTSSFRCSRCRIYSLLFWPAVQCSGTWPPSLLLIILAAISMPRRDFSSIIRAPFSHIVPLLCNITHMFPHAAAGIDPERVDAAGTGPLYLPLEWVRSLWGHLSTRTTGNKILFSSAEEVWLVAIFMKYIEGDYRNLYSFLLCRNEYVWRWQEAAASMECSRIIKAHCAVPWRTASYCRRNNRAIILFTPEHFAAQWWWQGSAI